MRCKICAILAVAELPQHRMALCGSCYLDWFPRYTAKSISKFRMLSVEDRVLVAVSGGKDSQALWTVLVELGYQADGMVIDLGIGDDGLSAVPGSGYSAESCNHVRKLAAQLRRPLWEIDLRRVLERTVPEIRRGQRPVCSACGVVKRYLMNRVAYEGGYDCVATGHNLDDEVAALFGNVLSWNTNYLGHQSPASPQTGERLMRKVKPFCYFTERETAMFAFLRNIPHYHEDCPNSVGATSITYKELINPLESRSPGTKRRFFDGYLRNREVFADGSFASHNLGSCARCSMPSPLELCAFCRMVGDTPIARPGGFEDMRPAGAPPGRGDVTSIVQT